MAHLSRIEGIAFSTYVVLCILLSLANESRGTENFKCPELFRNHYDPCSRVQCVNPVSKHSCPANTIYMDNFAFCGCCPSCVEFLRPQSNNPSYFEPCVNKTSPDVVWTPDPNCDDEEGFCTVKENTCLPGLVCNEATGNCEMPTNVPNPATEECLFRKSLRRLGSLHWDPDCEADGSFSPKQCKGSQYDGECFCVDREGKRIFGREWRTKAENQTCLCSRKAHELRKTQGLTATFHCSNDGNFEPLQCDTDSGLCYCVDPKTGELDGAVLPESQWKLLPCFTLNLTDHQTDGKYLRQCESEFAGLRQLAIIGKEHGMELQAKKINCDFDGSYAPVQTVNTQSQCVFKNGTRIKDYFMQANVDMTCNCARDKEEYLPSQEKYFTFDCQQRSGNYDVVYDFGSNSSCVDSDGFLYGEVVPSVYFCCLLDEGCSDKIRSSCYNQGANVTGIKHCEYWWYRD